MQTLPVGSFLFVCNKCVFKFSCGSNLVYFYMLTLLTTSIFLKYLKKKIEYLP